MESGGSIQGRFSLEARIGRGAFGDVYRAVDRETGALVAVKRLHQNLDEPVSAERFQREARMLARVYHPHVVRYVAHGPDDDGRKCIVVEWLEGHDLADRMKRRRVSADDAIEIARSYIPVLEAAATVVSELDASCSLAHLATSAPGSYVRPTLLAADSGGGFALRGARHPVMEMQESMTFIANDYTLDRDTSRFQIITG